jgi:hypothetical protein
MKNIMKRETTGNRNTGTGKNNTTTISSLNSIVHQRLLLKKYTINKQTKELNFHQAIKKKFTSNISKRAEIRLVKNK